MRMLLMAQIDTEKGSRAIADGSMPKIMQGIMEKLQPEAAYFAPLDGRRTAFLLFDLKEPAEIPSLVEPLFGALGADVKMVPAMNFEDVTSGMQRI